MYKYGLSAAGICAAALPYSIRKYWLVEAAALNTPNDRAEVTPRLNSHLLLWIPTTSESNLGELRTSYLAIIPTEAAVCIGAPVHLRPPTNLCSRSSTRKEQLKPLNKTGQYCDDCRYLQTAVAVYRHLHAVYGVWCMLYGVHGVYGVWCMLYGVYGVQCMSYSVWWK